MTTERPTAEYKQAERIIDKFGGVPRMALILSLAPTTIYKWTYPKERGGTNGLIPTHNIKGIRQAAPDVGIKLSDSDFAPN